MGICAPRAYLTDPKASIIDNNYGGPLVPMGIGD